MDRYIGLDAHASNCTLAEVSGSGKRLRAPVLTPPDSFRKLRGLAPPRLQLQRRLATPMGARPGW